MTVRPAAAALVLVLTVAACSEDRGQSSTSPSAARTTPSPTPSPVTPTSTGRPLPTAGPSTVARFRLLNQQGRGSQPAVKALDRFMVASTESSIRHQLTPEFRVVTSAAYQRAYSARLSRSKARGLTVPSTPIGRLEKVRARSGRATVVYCLWPSSVAHREEATGKLADTMDRTWFRLSARFVRRDRAWILADLVPTGDLCDAPAP